MRRLSPLLLAFFLMMPVVTSVVTTSVVSPSSSSGETEFLVFLSQQADLSRAASLPTRSTRAAYVVQQLRALAERTQAPLLAELQQRNAVYRSYWIANLIWVRGDASLQQFLASRPEVAHIYANPSIQLAFPPASASPSGKPSLTNGLSPFSLLPSLPQGIEWNIQKVNAPAVWAAGVTGQGAVIAGQDTGYQWDHPALKSSYRGWNGSTVDHNYNWHDAIHENNPSTPAGNPCGFDVTAPCDDYGHGTHTMGTMVGDDGAGNQIGMAPGARWIGCRNMEQGWGKASTYIECFEWFLAPTDPNNKNPRTDLAPDVINNSWSCPPKEDCSWDVLQSVVDNVRAAGIVVVVSTNNNGSACNTVNEPPAIYASALSVGATDSNDNIAGFSSRGPSAFTNLLKPEVSAPGVSIRSSVPTNTYNFSQGTSMAAPHVSGLIALLLSARPDLHGQVTAITQLIQSSAVPLTTSQECGGIPGSQVPNNTYGYGRIDAWSAYQAVLQAEKYRLFYPFVIR